MKREIYGRDMYEESLIRSFFSDIFSQLRSFFMSEQNVFFLCLNKKFVGEKNIAHANDSFWKGTSFAITVTFSLVPSMFLDSKVFHERSKEFFFVFEQIKEQLDKSSYFKS